MLLFTRGQPAGSRIIVDWAEGDVVVCDAAPILRAC